MRVLQAVVSTIILLGACAAASAQTGRAPGQSPGLPPQQQNQRSPLGTVTPDDSPVAADLQHRAEISRANERQKRMVADTEHLLALATELKADMDKTDKNILSLEVIKKADEIEKLAHDIKQRMRY